MPAAFTTPPLRYAVLRHDGVEEPHFDLLVETAPGSPLATWRSSIWPILDGTILTRLRDHRRLYLDYQGEVPGDRGRVTRIADGHVQVLTSAGVTTIITFSDSPIALTISALHDDQCVARLTTN